MNKHAQNATAGDAPDWLGRAFLNMKEASDICGISRSSIYSAAKSGKIALLTFSGRTVVKPQELKRFIEATAAPWTPNPKRVAHSKTIARAARTRQGWA